MLPNLISAVEVPWIAAGLGSLLVGLVLTPLVGCLARRWHLVDRPSEDRWHGQRVALLGGVAIAGAVGLGAALNGGVYRWPVWAGAVLLFGMGLADDLWEVRPETKVLVQIGAVVLLLYAGHAFWHGGPTWASLPLTFLWVIGVTNAFNLIDGVDGLATGIGVVAAGALTFISLVLGQYREAAVMASVAGASLGFLAYNAPPARVFMGDCGSLFLGYMLAVGALSMQSSGGPVTSTLLPVAVLAVPIFDTTFVTVTRLLRGQSVSEGGTDHIHHRLVRLGFSEGTVVMLLCGASGAFGAVALSALWMPASLVVSVATFCLIGAAVVGGYLASEREAAPECSEGSTPAWSQQIGAGMRFFAGGMFWKSVAGMLADLLILGAALIIAVHLRYSGSPPVDWNQFLRRALPGIAAAKVLVFYLFGLYEGIWRHAGTPEVVRLIGGSAVASLLAGSGTVLLVPLGLMPPGLMPPAAFSVAILDWIMSTAGIGGVRFGFRALRQYVTAHQGGGRRALLYGTGGDQARALRHLRHHSEPGRTVVGLLGEEALHDRWVRGTRVAGGIGDIPRLCDEKDIDEVIVCAGATPERKRQRIRKRCAECGVDCKYFSFSLRPASEVEPTEVELTEVELTEAGPGASPPFSAPSSVSAPSSEGELESSSR